MEKKGAENKVCTYCDKDAVPGTEPPVCEEHQHSKKASEPSTLKELDSE